jgi:hypothetical protein
MTLSGNQFEFLKDLATFIDYLANVKKLKITATWLFRTQEVQQSMLDQGLSKTLKSNHLLSCAIDLNIFYGKRILTNLRKKDLTPDELKLMQEISVFWENLNPLNRAGFNFKSIYDPGHFERNVK